MEEQKTVLHGAAKWTFLKVLWTYLIRKAEVKGEVEERGEEHDGADEYVGCEELASVQEKA